MSERNILRDVGFLEQRLGLPKGFYHRLLKEDDWSFVIKLSALFEAACSHALVTRLGAPELIDQFAKLEFADRDRGKVKFLTSLGSISSDQAAFLTRLAGLRNILAHDVSRVSFNFDEYVAAMDSNQRKQTAKVFGHGCNDPIPIEGKKIPLVKIVEENLKLVIWMTASEVLACLYLEYEIANIRLRTSALEEYRRMVSESTGAAVGN